MGRGSEAKPNRMYLLWYSRLLLNENQFPASFLTYIHMYNKESNFDTNLN